VRVLLFGATGMVGKGVLLECLDDPKVTSILSLVRTPTGIVDPKLEEILHSDFFDYTGIEERLRGVDACFFCLGISSAGMKEAEYHRWTYELAAAAADTLARLNPGMTFCFVSGTGTDSSEKGRVMWARVKGKAENHLRRLPFRSYFFRPGIIQPMRGITSRTRSYRIFYTLLAPLFPLLTRLFPGYVTTTEKVGKAMIHVAISGSEKEILENSDINALADAR
jgi:uncharacterized protein YbjT (DUF2867 family)